MPETPKGLILHCGNALVDRKGLEAVHTPDATRSWCPVPHTRLLDSTCRALVAGGYQIKQEGLSLNREGTRFFGVLEVQNGVNRPESSMCIGIRNSHDRQYSMAIVVGNKVFVCDNLSFSSEIRVTRKHTRHVLGDLDNMINRAMGRLGHARDIQNRRIEQYKTTVLDSAHANDLFVRAIEAKAFAPSKLLQVTNEWTNPRHAEFRPRNVWSAFNAITEILKPTPRPDGTLRGTTVWDNPRRTQALHGVCDMTAGISFSDADLGLEPIDVDAEPCLN